MVGSRIWMLARRFGSQYWNSLRVRSEMVVAREVGEQDHEAYSYSSINSYEFHFRFRFLETSVRFPGATLSSWVWGRLAVQKHGLTVSGVNGNRMMISKRSSKVQRSEYCESQLSEIAFEHTKKSPSMTTRLRVPAHGDMPPSSSKLLLSLSLGETYTCLPFTK
jgi:hypothetical protein